MPDQNVNVTVENKNGCGSGCGTILAVLLGIGLIIDAWQSVNVLGKIGLIAGTLVAVVLIGWAIDAHEKREAKAKAAADASKDTDA